MDTKPKCWISGINSFIGGYLTDKLVDAGYEVSGLVHEGGLKNDKATAYQGDLMDFKGITEILKKVQPDFILHLAARTEVEKSFYDPIEFSQINYVGTVNLIEKAREFVPNLKLFLFASTMETYGAVYSKEQIVDKRVQPQPFNEETPQHPNAPYAVAKIGCEKYLEYMGRAYQFPYTILRQTNAYGRWDNDFFVVEQIITQMLNNPKEINLGYKDPYRNFLYIDDLVELYLMVIAKYDDARGEVFCTGPNNALTIENLVELIADKIGWNGTVNWDTKPKRAGEIYYLNSTPKKAKKVLGWEPRVSLDEGLERTINIWKK